MMYMLYKYIFYKAYFLCIKVLREKEFPQYFASVIVTFSIVTNLLLFLELIEYLMLPQKIITYRNYIGYFALIIWGFILFYIHYKNRYLDILKDVEYLSGKSKKRLRNFSLLYLFILVVGFFLLGYLLRNSITHAV